MKPGQADWPVYEQSSYEIKSFTDPEKSGFFHIPLCLSSNPKESLHEHVENFVENGLLLRTIPILIVHIRLSPRIFVIGTSADKAFPPVFSRQRWEAHASAFQNKLSDMIQYRGTTYHGDHALMFASSAHTSEKKQVRPVIGQLLGIFWAPEFDASSQFVPYVPAHITRPKEQVALYQLIIPPECDIYIPAHLEGFFLSFEDCLLHPNRLIAHLPSLVSRFTFKYLISKVQYFHDDPPFESSGTSPILPQTDNLNQGVGSQPQQDEASIEDSKVVKKDAVLEE